LLNREQEEQIEELSPRAAKTPNTYEGIKANEALAASGEAAIPKLLEVDNDASIANPCAKRVANSEIYRIKKGTKH